VPSASITAKPAGALKHIVAALLARSHRARKFEGAPMLYLAARRDLLYRSEKVHASFC